MKRRLLTQIRAEWRSNIWLAIELTIISVVLFYIVDFLWVRFTVINEASRLQCGPLLSCAVCHTPIGQS